MEMKQLTETIMKGTTTIGVVCADGVVLGADTRISMGDFITSETAIKLQKIDENLGILYAGVAGYAQYIVKMLKVQNEFYKMTESKSMSPTAAASLLGFMLRESFSEFAYAGLIVGGLNNGVPEIYSLDPIGGAYKEEKYGSVGAGMASALGYLDSIYGPGMSVQEGVKHAVKALQMAMKRSESTGGTMKIAVISKKGFKEYSKEEIEKLLK